MSISAEDILTFFVEELHQQGVLIIKVAPERKFWLQDDAKFVCCDEGGFWRAPRVEAHMVQAVGCTGAEIILPRIDIHSHMSCKWPDAGIVLTTKEDLVAIGVEVLTFDVEILEVGVDVFRFLCCAQFCRKFDSSDDSVPVGLGVFCIGMTTGIELFGHAAAVIYHNGELVFTWSEEL